MRVLVIGSTGFVGRNVKAALSSNHQVIGAGGPTLSVGNDLSIDLLDRDSIARVLEDVKPEVIINCAGVISKNGPVMLNSNFTSNLLEEVAAAKVKPIRIVISGSAAEYGTVGSKDAPVSEDAPLNAQSGYGLSKLKETNLALEFRERSGLPVTIARIFNPIGPGMNPKMFIPKILEQIAQIKNGQKHSIKVIRLDSLRDYIDVKDMAMAIKAIVENEPKEAIYNIGSGKSTSIAELVKLFIEKSHLPQDIKIIETSSEPEPLVASPADISRLENELGWHPVIPLEETVEEVIHETR